jgi:hypothetical protein
VLIYTVFLFLFPMILGEYHTICFWPSSSIILCAKCMTTRTLAQHVRDYHELM